MAGDQQFCLRWNNHQSTLVSVFDSLLENSVLVDCTLAADGQQLKAHKVVLSACSPYLENLLSQHFDKHPIIILKDVKYSELKAMLDYMYRGEVNISQEQLGSFLKAAESLQIKGLTDRGGGLSGGGEQPNKQAESNRKHTTTTVQQSMTVAPVVNNQTRLTVKNFRGEETSNSLTTSEERKHQNLSIPSHLLDGRSQSPLQREGSVSPTLRKRKKLNQLNKSDGTKLVKTFNDNSVNMNKVNNCQMDQQLPSHITSSNNVTPASSPSANMTVIKSEPDVLPLTNKTEFKQNINDNVASVDNIKEIDNEENNENLYEEDTTNTTSPGPSHHFISQSYSEKLMVGDNSSEMLQSSEDMQSSNQDISSTRFSMFKNKLKTSDELVTFENLSSSDSEPLSDNKIFACPTCNKGYKAKSSLNQHLRLECGKEPRFSCPFCGKKCHQKGNLKVHVLSRHREQLKSTRFGCMMP